MADTETVTMRLPTGEEIDAVVPSGMSDDQIKQYSRMKKPELFGDYTPPGIQPPEHPIMQEIRKRATAGLAGVPGGAPQVAPATPAYQAAVGLPLAAAATVMGGAAAAPLAIAGGKAVVSHVARNPIKYSLGIEAARQLPYGDMIPSWAAMVPFLLGGGKAAAVPAAEAAAETGLNPMQKWWKARGGVMAEERVGGVAIKGPGPQARPQPTPSPTTPPPTAAEPDMEMLRRQAGIRPEPAAPSAENTFMGELAKKKPVNLSELEAAGAKHETRTVEKAALERPKTEAERVQQEAARRGQPPTATSGPKADLLEDKGIMERMRASMEADRVKAAQEYRANNTITTTKGELIEKAGTVKYTTTPPAPAKVDLNDSSTLQKLLKQSVKAAKAKKR